MKKYGVRLKRLENINKLTKDKINKLYLEYISLILRGKINESTEEMREVFKLMNIESEELRVWLQKGSTL
ncbi:hypothetical protein Arnit_0621 [Arcobacter nitrofigilis DSM 7299]|uniref:Uncharacterized protein n=1 Tax=Arcobacter nitrofigilis (strain ATCC 33309 / DSM 7299 / CCUG 15893 / LMG 7604 / NCTC 12251 / CI) TaxID=572480 RepID=D5V253_ARCNC|nr:hypothetical protein [Arcobacter nitrofigilis]ADG92286.1 hypothetical protein Arnit_0621 [Arcobacter nitrofigilis DSM 7299]